MSNRIDSLNLYLQQARVNVRGPDGGAIVMGNEAADLDSMVSAMLYGLLASSRHAPGSPSVAPVINCPRNDFSLRTEAVYLFTELNVDVAALLFIDEVDVDALHRAGRLRLPRPLTRSSITIRMVGSIPGRIRAWSSLSARRRRWWRKRYCRRSRI